MWPSPWGQESLRPPPLLTRDVHPLLHGTLSPEPPDGKGSRHPAPAYTAHGGGPGEAPTAAPHSSPGGQSRVHTHTPNSCCVGLPPTGTITSTLRKLTGGHWGTVCLVAIRPHGTGSLFPRPHLSDAACWPSGVRRVPPCTAQGGVWLQKVTEQDSPGSPTEAESRRKVRLRIDNDAHLHCGPQPARGCFLKVRSESYSFA